MNLKKYISIPLTAVILAMTLQGCDDDDSTSTGSFSFYPLTHGEEWTYQRWIANGDEGRIFDTLLFAIGDQVVVDGQTYTQIVDSYGAVKLIRHEGSKFYGRQHELYNADFSHEYLFLDTDMNIGESWSYDKNDAYTKTEYIVTGKGTRRTVNGVVYNNVIEMRVNYYREEPPGQEYLWLSAEHWYARGVGEIYSFYPYPVSLIYGDISSYIMR